LFGDPLLKGAIPILEIGCLCQHAILGRLRRRTDLTLARSAAWSTGFVRYSSAPASSPATMSLVSE
jgi:hypothetical protein